MGCLSTEMLHHRKRQVPHSYAQETKGAVKGVRAAKAKESRLKQRGVRPAIARKEALSGGRTEGRQKKQRSSKSAKGPRCQHT